MHAMLAFWFPNSQCLKSSLFSVAPEHCTDPEEEGPMLKQLHQLQGLWQSELDNRFMGEIKGHAILWDPGLFNEAETELFSTKLGSIEMRLMGSLYQATLENGLQPRLRWSDGEVWVRVDLNTVLMCSSPRSCAWDDEEHTAEISLSIDMGEVPSRNHHPLPPQDSSEFMIDPGDNPIPHHEQNFREQLQLPHMDIWPCPPTCTSDASLEERKALLWEMYEEFALELYVGTTLKQLVSRDDYVDTHMKLMDDMHTLKLDQNTGNIIEFPLRNVSKVYRMIKHGDRWRGASNPALRAVIRGDAEEVVVMQFLRRKVAFALPTVDETQRFMLCIGLLARRAKEKYISDREYARYHDMQCGPDSGIHCSPREIACGSA